MRKKIIAFLLVAVIVIGITPLMSLAEEGDTVTAVRGDTTYALTADPDTGTVPDGFGTVSNNGRIWTDKSVSVKDDRFEANLKVLAQEYISSSGTTETQSIAADVLFILDFTGSMTQSSNYVLKDDGTRVSRLKAMVDAANEAIEIITTTNPNNRIKLFRFSGSTSNCQTYSKEIMPLAHYTSSSTSADTVDKYIRLSGSNTVASSSTLLKDGVTYTFSEQTQNNTCTQYGIAAGVKSFIDDINAESDNSIERRPYVIMLTDGEPTLASKNWYSEDLSDLRTQTITSTSGGDRNELMATGTILTSAIWRDRLADAYESYNSNNKEIDVQWFNIGLGISEPDDADSATYTSCLLNPNYLVGVEGRNGTGATSREKIKYYISQSDWAPAYTAKDYSANDNYVYINDGDGYVTFANTYSVLMNAFTTLANIIRLGSMEYTIPIVNHEGSGETSSDVIFTDVIGEGMYITDIVLKQNGAAPVTGEDPDGDGVYTFHGYNTTVTVTEDSNGQQTLVWSLPASEVAMFTFADREDVTNGEYISAEPTVLTYGVDFTNDIEEGPAYTNAFDQNMVPRTTVTYEIPGDNDYYFDVVKDTEHNFISSTLKTDFDGSTQKTDNVTSTASDSHSYAYTAVNDGTADSSATVSGLLGNNGKATFLSRKENLELTVEKKWEDSTGNPIETTTGLPAVEVTLYRTADGGSNEETVQVFNLSNADGYSETLTLPIRNSDNKLYTYYIREDCPDGYYIASISSPLCATDGALTVTNREFPEEGIVAVRKLWKNKIGATITDTSALSGVDIELWRSVKIISPSKYTVTITCTGSGNDVYPIGTIEVKPGTDISFVVRVFIQRQNTANQNSTTMTVNGQSVSWNGQAKQVRYYEAANNNNNYWCRDTVTQTFTVNSDMVLNYVCSKTLNTSTINVNATSTPPVYPCYTLDTNGNTWSTNYTEPDSNDATETTGDDELVETVSLNNQNGWQKVFDDLVLSETGAGGEVYNYKYFVKEVTEVPGFVASYSANNTGGIEGGLLTVTNTSTTAIGVLPETGGRGSPQIVIAGAVTVLFALVFMFTGLSPGRRKRHRKHT
ncbi:MAG: hypothetical protein IJK60_06385 [Clostridia bacterium]|nr:hypothetical protein [Clostridia bacterium]